MTYFKRGKSKNQKSKGEFWAALEERQKLFSDCQLVVLCDVRGSLEGLTGGVQHLSTPAAYEPVLAWTSVETIFTVGVMQVSVDDLKMLWEVWDAFTVLLICLSPRQWYIPPTTAQCACSLSGRRTCSPWLVSTSSVAAAGSSTVQCLSRMVLELVSSMWILCCICPTGHSDESRA